MTDCIPLGQRRDREDGVLIFHPVYRGITHADLQARRREIKGYATAVVLFEDAVRDSFQADQSFAGVDLQIEMLANPANSRVLYRSNPSDPFAAQDESPGRKRAVEVQHPCQLAGRELMFRFRRAGGQAVANRSWQPWFVLAGGLLFTQMLGAFLLTVTGGRVLTEQLVEERTSELGRANAQLESDIIVRERAEEKFRVLFEYSSDAHLLFDEERGILDSNPAAVEMLGYPSKAALLGVHPARLSPELQPDGRRSMEKCLEMDATAHRNGYHRFEWSHQRINGEVFPCEVTLTPVPLAGKSVILVVWHDLSERKRVETELADRARELAKSNAELEQFAYIASHDLREPLSMVQIFCGLLRDRYGEQLDERANTYIDFAVGGAARMLRLIEDLLEYSRVGRTGERLESISLESVLSEVLIDLQVAIENSGATVEFDQLPTIRGNALRLSQVFQNLIGNAIKFRSAAPPVIKITACRQDDDWRIDVTDNGIGIDPKFFPRLFVVFQRLHTQDEFPGTGIGLALCKRIVEMHGGRIWLDSQPGRGTSFHFLLSPSPELSLGSEPQSTEPLLSLAAR